MVDDDEICGSCGRSIYDVPDYFYDEYSGTEWACHYEPSGMDDIELQKKWIELEGIFIRTHGADKAKLIELPNGCQIWVPLDMVRDFDKQTFTVNVLFAVKRGLISINDKRIKY